MAVTATVSTIIAHVRQLTDTESMDATAGFITDAHLVNRIDHSYRGLYRLLARKRISITESVQTITGDGTATHALDAAFLYPIGVAYQIDSDTWSADLKEIDVADRNRYSRSAGVPCAYRIVGATIQFYPPMETGKTAELVYIPIPTAITATTDTFDGINGYEEWMAYDVAVEVAIKLEIDPSALMAERKRLRDDIDQDIENRNVGPHYILDGKAPMGDRQLRDRLTTRYEW